MQITFGQPCLTALQTLNPISPTISWLPPAIAVAQSFPSLPSTCNQARGLRQTRLHLGRVLINAQIAAYFYAGAYVVQKTHVAILVDRAYKPHFCADGEVRWLDLAFTRRRSSPNSGRTP